MADWFSQLATKFTTSPMAAILRAADRDNGWRFLDLVSLARECNQEGRLVDVIGDQETPWSAETLCYRVQCTPTEYQSFLDLCVGRGWLLTDDAGAYCLPNPRYWWGAKTDAERQAEKRHRDRLGSNERNPDSTRATESSEFDEGCPSATFPPSDNVPSLSAPLVASRDVTEVSRTCHDVSRDVTPLYTDLQTDQEPISIQRSRRTGTARAPGPSGSLQMDKSIGPGKAAGAFGEPQFMTMVVSLFEQYTGQKWGSVPLRKLRAVLRRPWATMHQDWSVRIAAIRFGLLHMADDRQAIRDGTRATPIDDEWNFALSMAPKYASRCADLVAANRRRVANGEKALPVTWERVEWTSPEGSKAG